MCPNNVSSTNTNGYPLSQSRAIRLSAKWGWFLFAKIGTINWNFAYITGIPIEAVCTFHLLFQA